MAQQGGLAGKHILFVDIVGKEVPDYGRLLAEQGAQVSHVHVPEGKKPLLILRAFWACRNARVLDAIVTNEYCITFGAALAARLTGAAVKIVGTSFNLSRKPLKFSAPFLNRQVNRVFQRVDRFIVHSSVESDLYAGLHELDRSRFHFVPFGFDLPAVAAVDDIRPPSPYVTVIGRNNRDFDTVREALQDTGIAGVFVGAEAGSDQDDSHLTIRCFPSLPMDRCLGLMAHAMANIIPLKDSSRGAGHITAVAAMLLSRAHIFSRSPVIQDYLMDGVTGIAVDIGNVDAMRKALIGLRDNGELREAMGAEARKQALEKMSHKRVTQEFAENIFNEMIGI